MLTTVSGTVGGQLRQVSLYIGKCTPNRHITDDKTDTEVSAQHSAPVSL